MFRSVVLVLITLALASSEVVTQAAERAVLCTRLRNNGSYNSSPKVRTACRPNEIEIDQSVIGLSSPIVVKDTNDTFVGAVTVAGWGGIFTEVTRLINGDAVTLQVNRAGFRSNSPEPRLYASNDCSGQAYLSSGGDDADLFYSGTVANGIAVYGKGSSTTITVSSRLLPTTAAACSSVSGAFADGFCCTQTGPYPNATVRPAIVSDLNPAGLEPPFHVE